MLAGLAVCISVTFQILLPVVPVMAERQGPHGIAGAATAALFIGAVTGELLSPWLMSRRSSTRLLVAGQLLSAVPSLVYLMPHAPIYALLGAASARGLGMGVAIVVSVALLSEVTPSHRRGTTIGYYSLALSVPGIFVPSTGVFLLAAGHVEIAALIAFGSILAGVVFALRIPARSTHVVQASTNLLAAVRRPGLLVVFAGFVLISCSFGGVITYAPIALPLEGLGSAAVFLFVVGAGRALSRWVAGVLGDRLPARTLLIAGMSLCLAGLIVLAAHAGGAAVVLAAAAYGSGYGTTQTAAYLAMTERGTAPDSGAISALWNSGIDLGASFGGVVIGLAAANLGYGTAAWVLPFVVLMSLPLFLSRGPALVKADPGEPYAAKS